MGVTYARELFDACYSEAIPLLEQHYAEIAHFQDIKLNVDIERYRAAEAAGALRIYTARLPDQRLVGYAAFAVGRNPHYADSLQAVNDVIYLDPNYRRGRVGVGLIAYCDEQLALEGVQVVRHHVKRAHPKLGFILEHKFGYAAEDTIMVKRLDIKG